MFAASRSNFSAPDGFGVNTRRGPRASAASMRPGSQKPREISEQTSQAGIRAVDASLGGQNIRIARRMIVTTTLKRSLALDVAITSFDVCLHANMLATCMGKMVYLWALDTLTVLQKFGRTTGSVHRENIRDCKFNLAGTLLATCGEDKRIVIWNLKTNRSQK
ncbi:hypothetical protein DFS34DRAFT_237700 [Phlyctochytrium arcticum]|nr:hypothetical protein DFS34DRAFT_237700 [Phlyctochytrium arcticum]